LSRGSGRERDEPILECSKCVVCDGSIRRVKRALVAPFLAERIWRRAPFCVDLVSCCSCGFLFYNPRLEDDELLRLYRDYRSSDYQRMRHSAEPWYTEKFNADLASASSYAVRQMKLAPILDRVLFGKKISRVLDYGGDSGDLVAGLIEGAEAFVYDISGKPGAQGVTATMDPASCQADLIVNSNVLEHVGFPRVLMSELLDAAPIGGLLFIEVPCEQPFGSQRLMRRTAQMILTAFTRPRLLRYVLRPSSLYMMHEHVNYFTEASLIALVRVAGGAVVSSGSYGSSGRGGKADMAWCLAAKQ